MTIHTNSISKTPTASDPTVAAGRSPGVPGDASPSVRVWLRSIGNGALLWAVPFLVSIPFFNRAGELQIDLFAFKSLMAVVGSATGVILLLRYLGRVYAVRAQSGREQTRFWPFGLATGVLWLGINWGLDFLVLLPLNGQSPAEYMLRIGLGYLAIPIAAVGIAFALDQGRRANAE